MQYIKKDKKKNTFPISEIENKTAIEETERTKDDYVPELYKAIGQLKKLDRLIIMMVLENQDYDSISEVIGIKPTNVRVKIHRIKKRLETILKNNKNTPLKAIFY